MNFSDYQKTARKTAIYKDKHKIIYPTLGLCGETGEVSEKIKKILRDKNGDFSAINTFEVFKELGDVLWYLANLATDLHFSLDNIAQYNLDKLKSRKQRNKLKDNGDNR